MRVRGAHLLLFQWHHAVQVGARDALPACITDYGNQERGCRDRSILKRNPKIIRMKSNTLVNKTKAVGF